MCIRQRIGGSNPPLTAIFKLRACTEVRAFCLYVSPKPRGDENHRPGFDTKTPGAFLNRACSGPEGARPRDGLSSGAASWTDDELARRLPEGRAQRVNPPHRHIRYKINHLQCNISFVLHKMLHKEARVNGLFCILNYCFCCDFHDERFVFGPLAAMGKLL